MSGEIVQTSDNNNLFTFEWRITQFCFCCTISYTSPNFKVELDGDEYTWCVTIRNCFYDGFYTNCTSDKCTHLELNLIDLTVNKRFDIKLKTSILERHGDLINTKESTNTVSLHNKKIYITNFIDVDTHQSYQKSSCSVVPGGTLTVVGEIVSKYINKLLSINNRESISLQEDLKLTLNDGKFSDLLLIVDEQEIRVHKVILASRSPVFLAMLNSDMAEKQIGKVEIADIDYETMKQLLLYIYTGKIENPELAIKLLGPADKYALQELKTICAAILSRTLTIENTIKILKMSELYGVSELKTKALDFMAENFRDIAKTDVFKSLLLNSNSPSLENL